MAKMVACNFVDNNFKICNFINHIRNEKMPKENFKIFI